MRKLKLLVYLISFIGLTAVGIYWSIEHYQLKQGALQSLSHLSQLGTHTKLLLLLLYLALYVTDIWRYQVLAAALGRRIGFFTGLEVSIANDFFSWITPGAAMGAPAATYVLGKKGMPWDVAGIICFAKSMLGSAILVIMALAILILNLGPSMPSALIAILIWGFSVILLIIGVPIIAAIRLSASVALISSWEARLASGNNRFIKVKHYTRALLVILRQSIERLAKLESNAAWIVKVSLIHIPYILVFAGMLTIILWDFSRSYSSIALFGSIEYLAFTYVAPTPGAAGLSEASAAGFFSQLLSPAQALVAVILFRACTIYLHIAVGMIYITFKSGITIILRGKKNSNATA